MPASRFAVFEPATVTPRAWQLSRRLSLIGMRAFSSLGTKIFQFGKGAQWMDASGGSEAASVLDAESASLRRLAAGDEPARGGSVRFVGPDEAALARASG